MSLAVSNNPSQVVISGSAPGPAGLSVTGVAISLDQHLLVTLSDESQLDAGLLPEGLPGVPGPKGPSIQSATLDTQGRLVLTMTDGSLVPPIPFAATVTPVISFQMGATLPAGQPASVVQSGSAAAPTVTINLPRGATGTVAGLLPATAAQVAPTSAIVGVANDGITPVLFTPAQLTQTQTSAFGQLGRQVFSGDGTTRAFNLSQAPNAGAYTLAFVGGAYQPGSTVSVSGSTVTFSAAPASGAAIEVLTITPTAAAGLLTTNPAADPAYAAVDPSGFTLFEFGPLGQFRPASIQLGRAGQTSIPLLDAFGNQVGSFGSDGSHTITGALKISRSTDGSTSFADQYGFVSVSISASGVLSAGTLSAGAGNFASLSATTATFSTATIGKLIQTGQSALASGSSIGGAVLSDQTAGAVSFADQNGFIVATIDAFGFHGPAIDVKAVLQPLTLPAGSSLGGLSVTNSPNFDFAISDPNGFLIFMQVNGVATSAAGGQGAASSTAGYSASDIATRNSRNLAYSTQVKGQLDTTSARAVWNLNHFLMYGQSLSTGQEGWPALSVTQKYDNLMLGGCVRPQTGAGTVFTPVTDTGFHALTAQVSSGTGVMAASDQAALAPGSAALGETPLEGAVNLFRRLQLKALGLAADPSRLLVASNCGVSGRSIEELSKGYSTEYFNRLRTCVSQAKANAVAAGKTYGIAAVAYMQGEYNYLGAGGDGSVATTSHDQYLADLIQLRSDINADLAVTISGQPDMPGFFTYQCGAQFTKDTIAIGQAQLDAALTQVGWYLFAPVYPVTDKGGHLDPNGYRWMGAQLGKVMYRVLVLGQRWLPLYPTQITFRGQSILVDFHVPEPPLVFDRPYSGTDGNAVSTPAIAPTEGQVSLSNNGFTVTDDAGLVPIATTALVSDTQVLITLGRMLTTNPFLVFADATHNQGNGGLRDSDPTTSDDVYAYTAGSGQYSAANIPALNNNPYPLWNWCCAFRVPITAG